MMRLPYISSLRQLAAQIRQEIQKCLSEARVNRATVWKLRMQHDFASTKKSVYAWCKNDEKPRIVMVQRGDSSFTANATEMHKLISDHWMPIFRMYDVENEPSVELL